MKQLERRLSHDLQHVFRGVFGRYFQSSRNVMADQLPHVFVNTILLGVLPVFSNQHVVANPATNKYFFDSRHLRCLAIQAG